MCLKRLEKSGAGLTDRALSRLFYVIWNYGTLFSDYVILKAQTE